MAATRTSNPSRSIKRCFLRPITFVVLLVLAIALVIVLEYPITEGFVHIVGIPSSQRGVVNNYTDVRYDHVINPLAFPFLIDEPDKCSSNQEDVFLLVIIHSSPSHSGLRKVQRRSTLSETLVLGKRIVVVYMLGTSKDTSLNKRVRVESEEYRDIILGDYGDSYYSLTHKFMMGMKWASQFCSKARYVLKGDDDVYFNLHHIMALLETAPSTDYMAGYVYKDASPYRSKNSKWFVSEREYPNDSYPPFCRGYAYLLSGDLPSRLLATALRTPFFPMDDVFVGFLAKRLGVTPVNTYGFRGPGGEDKSFCLLNLSHAVHVSDGTQIEALWREQRSPKSRWSCSRIAYLFRSIF